MLEVKDKLVFRGQRSGEEVKLAAHRHPWVFFKPGLQVMGFVIVLIFVVKILGFSSYFSLAFFIILPIIIYIITHQWFIWINTTYLLTNERIIAVFQKNWFSRTVTEAPLANIMTVTHQVEGPIKSILNFGDVAIRSSGASENEIVLRDVFDPFDVQQKILAISIR